MCSHMRFEIQNWWISIIQQNILQVNFLLLMLVRFLSFMLFAPILSRLGYGMTFRYLLLCMWSGLKAPLSLTLALRFHSLFLSRTALAHQIAMHIIGLFILSYFINGSLIPLMLRLVDLAQVSMAKQVNMNNCVRYALARRERAISVLKMYR